MKKFKSKYIIGIAFICIIAFFFGSVCYRVYRAKRYFDYGTGAAETSAESAVTGDKASTASALSVWQDKYPFSEEYKFVPTQEQETADSTETTDSDSSQEASAYLIAVNKFIDSVDYYTTKLLPGRMKYVEANALFNKTVGMKIISGTDSVVVMKNGYLTFEYGAASDAQVQAESVKWFSDIMEKKGINFMYVQYPAKEKEGDNQLPDGITDTVNTPADNLLKGLDESGVNYCDMRLALSQKGGDWYSNFFKTDHHWKPETGVWAAGQILSRLNSDFGLSLDTSVGNIDNYSIDVYEKYCLGSQGKIATLTYADPEDISIIYPKNATSVTVKYDNDASSTGRFEDVIFNKQYLNNTDYYNYSAYSAYLNGNKALSQITNNDCKNGKKLLVIGGSYNKCVVPYLSRAFESTTLLDRRYFDGSVIDYIDKTKPDVVIVAYTPTLIGSVYGHTATFNFE